jgi:hypothetical protein
MHEQTKRLGLVDAATCERLLDEALGRPFTPHARGRQLGKGPLRHGETAYIRELAPYGDSVYEDNLEHFPVFRAFLESTFSARKVGKSYWHRMKARTAITRHIDCGNYYDLTHRFQLFPKTEAGQHALVDGGEEHFPSGTLLAFNPTIPHAYENRTERDCVFLVFDLYPGEYALPAP